MDYSSFVIKAKRIINKHMKNLTKVIIKDAFEIFLVGFSVLFVFEIYLDGFVSSYLNMNYLLGILLGLAILSSVFPPEKEEAGVDKISFVKIIMQVAVVAVFAIAILWGMASASIWMGILAVLLAALIYFAVYNLIKS